MDQVENLVLSRVICLGQLNSDSLDQNEGVLSIVRALGKPGSSLRISLGQVFAKSAASKKLKGAKVVKGFQRIITGTQGMLHPGSEDMVTAFVSFNHKLK